MGRASKNAAINKKRYRGWTWTTAWILSYCAHNEEFTLTTQEDINEFERVLIKQYASTVSNALREVDSVHLNLGMR